MEETHIDLLRHHQLAIVDYLEPRDVLDSLYQDGILTENDVENVTTGNTRRERCQTLLAMLPRRGPTAYGAFTHALKDAYYDHLSDSLMAGLEHAQSYMFDPIIKDPDTVCECGPFLPPESESSSELLTFLHQHCCILIKNVEPKEVIDYHYQMHVLSLDDCEYIKTGTTRLNRCKYFFETLSKSSSNQVLSVFCKSLERKYSFILDKIRGNSTEYTGEASNKNARKMKNNVANALEVSDGCHFLESAKPVDLHQLNTCGIVKRKGNVTTENNSEGNLQISVNPGSIKPYALPNQKLFLAFDHLSCMINQGKYDQFEHASSLLQQKYATDSDMCCLLSYLKASRFLFGNMFDKANKEICCAFELVPKTSNPKYFTVELFTAKTRMYITQKKLQKLEEALEDVKQIIETDPVGCSGRAAGWLYMNDARSKTAQMSLLNLNKPKAVVSYNTLFAAARKSFQKALENFREDGGKDGPFGCGYALCRLAILLLRCGDNGLTMDVMQSSDDDIHLAGKYIKTLENSSIPLSKILNVHFLLAKCDYYYRRGNTVRALENAKAALCLSSELNMMEFKEHAHNRELFLKTKNCLVIHDVSSDEQIMDILMADSNSETLQSD